MSYPVLGEMWRALGPRIETVRKAATPGRNDPCFCGSGKKHKSAANCYQYSSCLRNSYEGYCHISL